MSKNGYLTSSELVAVDGGGWTAYLNAATARAWNAACAEMVALGHPRPKIKNPDGAYRSYPRQVYWKTYWTARGLPLNAATPGLSNHGTGDAVDIDNYTVYTPKDLHGVFNRHGFVFDVASEAWHAHRTGINPADSGSTPILPIERDIDMPKNYHNADGTIFTLGETFGIIWGGSSFSYLANRATFDPLVEVNMTSDQITTVVAEANARGKSYAAASTATVTLTSDQLAAIGKSITVQAIDYAALAKAVNDDAAKRLAN